MSEDRGAASPGVESSIAADAAAGAAPLLSARGLVVRRERATVLDGVDLDLRAGEIVVLVGPNGAGKSTLVDALAGLVAAAGGAVTRRGRVAAALQHPGLARRSARANVELALSWWGAPRAGRRARAEAALAALDAGHLAGHRATTLSGGEQRRVHLARSLAVDPDVLLLDEPFAGLDSAVRARLLESTGSALRQRAGATLVVLHDLDDAWALADRLLVLLDGRIVADGTPDALLASPPDAAAARFLGYDGSLARDGGLLTRPEHVVADAAGEPGTVRRVIRTRTGSRVQVELADGTVWMAASVVPALGDVAHVRVVGGAPLS